jgi:sugar/nucleoside kinase (ribokinase family)
MRAQYDVLGIGNAIMDVIAPVGEDMLVVENITKASMTLIDQKRALHLHRAFKKSSPKVSEIAGGSGANTIAGSAALGVSAAYIGKVADDGLGKRFTESLGALGVTANTAPLKKGEATARSLIAVTPDGERSMSTYLGANVTFGVKDIDAAIVRASTVTYMEGYLFDTDAQKAAFVKAAEIAKAAGRQVALTLSDSFCVDRHRAAFSHLVDNHVDILFANEDELLSLYETKDLNAALNNVWATGTTTLVTLSDKGSLIKNSGDVHEIPAMPVDKVIDTTGAGDQYAAGVLAGRAMGLSWQDAGRLGSICASEVISHFGARPETAIHDLVVSGVKCL